MDKIGKIVKLLADIGIDEETVVGIVVICNNIGAIEDIISYIEKTKDVSEDDILNRIVEIAKEDG